jgi:hypothetical protein
MEHLLCTNSISSRIVPSNDPLSLSSFKAKKLDLYCCELCNSSGTEIRNPKQDVQSQVSFLHSNRRVNHLLFTIILCVNSLHPRARNITPLPIKHFIIPVSTVIGVFQRRISCVSISVCK